MVMVIMIMIIMIISLKLFRVRVSLQTSAPLAVGQPSHTVTSLTDTQTIRLKYMRTMVPQKMNMLRSRKAVSRKVYDDIEMNLKSLMTITIVNNLFIGHRF